MPIYKPSELKAFLDEHGIRPNKRLSQNFLVDANVLKKIITSADVQANDVIIEIGPGAGALTEQLLSCGCRVIAIEKDPVLASSVQRFSRERLTVICADALDVDCKALLRSEKAKVVSNLPYHITSKLLEKLVVLSESISSCTVMVQEDAAKRFIEKKGAKAFGFCSLFLQYHALLSHVCKVSSKCFYPKPHIDSCVLQLILQKRYPISDEARFFSLLEKAFCHRRKAIMTTFAKDFSQEVLEKALVAIGKNRTTRPEELELGQWIEFYKRLGDDQ